MRAAFFVLLPLVAFLSGCATSDPASADSGDVQSSIPWNSPQKWETGSNVPGLGIFNQEGR